MGHAQMEVVWGRYTVCRLVSGLFIGLVVAFAFMSASMVHAEVSDKVAPPAPVHHVVVAWYKEPITESRYRAMLSDLQSFTDIPGVVSVHGGAPYLSPRLEVDDTFSFAVTVVLESLDHLAGYQTHDIHQSFLRQHVKGRIDDIVIYDF